MWIINARVGDKNEYLAPRQMQTMLILVACARVLFIVLYVVLYVVGPAD